MSTTHNYFDLIEFIRGVKNLEVSSQMAQSMAFRVDVNIQQAARQLFKLVRTKMHESQLEKNIDNLADLTAALGEQAFAERCFHEIGSDVSGPVETIRDLMAIRDDVHEMAAKLTSYCLDWQGHARQYEIPNLDDRFYEKPKLKVGELEKRRAETSARRRTEAYGLTPEESEKLLARKMNRKESNLREVEDTLTNQAHIVHTMFNLAMSAHIEGFTPADSFYKLDLVQQRQMIEACLKAAERTEEYAERDRNMSESMFDDIGITVMRVVRDFNGVLNSPRFSAHAAAQEAIAQNVG